MGSFSLAHWAILIVVIMLLFGRGRISDLMGDFAKGITSFKRGLAEGDAPPAAQNQAPPQQVTHAATPPATPVNEDTRR
jgi:sec-independent protein translocase protein TatA